MTFILTRNGEHLTVRLNEADLIKRIAEEIALNAHSILDGWTTVEREAKSRYSVIRRK